jgi:hypothetical protein
MVADNDDRTSQNKLIQSSSFILITSVCQHSRRARWFNRTEVTEMGRRENKKKDKEQSDQKKSPPTDSSVRVIGQKRKR